MATKKPTKRKAKSAAKPKAGARSQKITTFLWYEGRAEEAARLYCSLFPDSRILSASPLVVEFELAGQKFMALNGGPMFKFTEAISLFVTVKDQAEFDHFWFKLTADGGEEGQCGWLKDKYGVSWQINPVSLMKGLTDPARAQRVQAAMMKMKRIDVAAIERA